ncbi:MAG: Asp-tRNA(Asn)/Glu-tRNA(Gln) amidotransferase subunit GatC [Ruminococcus sp.]
MKIDIAHIAKTFPTSYRAGENGQVRKDMAAIVDMVDRLPDVEDELTLDAAHPMKLREDVAVEHKFRREEMLANAPEVQSGCLVVPKTVE